MADDPDKTKEAAGVVTSIVDALRTQPMLIAILVLNALFVLVIQQGISGARKREHKLLVTVITRCLPQAMPAAPAP